MSQFHRFDDPCFQCGEHVTRGLVVMTGDTDIDACFDESVFCSEHCRDTAITDYRKERDKTDSFAYGIRGDA